MISILPVPCIYLIPDHAQVLTGCDAAWITAAGGQLPEGALPSGESESGEPLFVGRATHEGTLTVGKVSSSLHSQSAPFSGGYKLHYSL